jgi:hypothetical protein
LNKIVAFAYILRSRPRRSRSGAYLLQLPLRREARQPAAIKLAALQRAPLYKCGRPRKNSDNDKT